MGRKKKNASLQEKIDGYLREYELDDLNQANDMSALTQMCRLEINMEQIQTALEGISDPAANATKVRDLHSALKAAQQSWLSIQTELGINRRKRKEDDDESPVSYIQRIQDQAKKFLDMRLQKLVCPSCGQILGKFMFYVTEQGEGGSIESTTKVVVPYKRSISCECWKCRTIATVQEQPLLIEASKN